jgi:hemerythrin
MATTERQHIWKIEWHEQMSVGIPEVDADHKHFVQLVNDFNQAIVDRMHLAEIKQRLQHILFDARQHFAHEEELFRQWRYPDYEDHAIQHAQILRALQDISDASVSYDMYGEWIEAGMQIKDVLIDHIMKEDMKYAGFHRARLGRKQFF